MSNGPVKTGATYQDLIDLPDIYIGEIISGDLYASRRPAPRQSHAAMALTALLGMPYQLERGGPGGWVFLKKIELHFGEDVLVPDIAAWRRERLPTTVWDEAWIEIPPDWLCEVLSPSTAELDRRKLPLYARVGVPSAWVLDAVEKTVEVLDAREGEWSQRATFSGDAVVRAPPFDAIELELRHLWLPGPLPSARG